MRRERQVEEMRCALAIAAAAGTVLICLHQQHFVLTLAEPRSVLVMMTHRCGMVMLAANAWAGLESMALLLLPERRQQTV